MATAILPGNVNQVLSYDKVIEDAKQSYYPTEFLNSLNVSGLPPHRLNLKDGMPIMMLRNLNPSAGLCNGTRLIIKSIQTRFIEASISFGTHKGKNVLIPRMPLIPSDTNLPFEFERNQFPIRPSFCMTINKAQGQTLQFASVWLGDEFVFTHGQLYVALSRVSNFSSLLIAINDPNFFTRNVVFTEILKSKTNVIGL